MSSEPQKIRLDSVAQINPRRQVRKGNSVPFIEMAALPQHSRDISMADISKRAAKSAGAHFQNGDTLLARITPCLENGKTAQVRCLNDSEVGEGSTEFIVLCGIELEDNDYIYYLCRDPAFREYAISRMEGTSGRQRVSWQSIAGYEFSCPPSIDRRAAARFLTTIDDRITLLRETNATLEAIAQALFKSWFVDFDPVRAKMEGRAPEGMDEATAALFPDSFEESELGLVPKGWSQQRLESFVELAYGKALKATDRVPGDIPVYGSGGITGFHNESLVDGPSIIVGRKGTVGSLYWEDQPFFPIDTVFYIRSTLPMTYCFYLLQTLGLSDMNTDAAVPGLNRNNVYRLLVALPPSAVLDAFDNVVTALRNNIFRNQQQAQTLATLRDTLLPRLISGQLRLPEAESAIEAAL